ncbi:MAG TPA: hypothetical protein VJ692_09005 [Nitrospiraceae bacterium]|nr:hypothetical protein [Nitrospiraceae bacterium]
MTRPSGLPDPSPLLLASGLTPEQAGILLKPYGIEDVKRADANLQSIAGEPRSRTLLAGILSNLLAFTAETADPDQALTHWDRFLQAGANRIQLFQFLADAPPILHLLCRLFGNSPSMAETLIRDPLLVYWLVEEQVLTRRPLREDLDASLRRMLANVSATELKLDALRRFRRREMLRIGVRDLLRLADVRETTETLSDVAGILIQAAYEITAADLRKQYGTPAHRNYRGKLVETGFAVIAMGKLGGGELNFSSDVDLIYVYASDQGATGSAARQGSSVSIPNEEYFEYLARRLTAALTEQTHEGFVYRVDLRLRAEGSVGQLARSLDGYRQYYRTRGQGWERQALLKAWPIAGDRAVGRAFLRMARPFMFERPDGRNNEMASVLAQVKDMKATIDAKIADRGHERRNVKLGIGGIREIEFFVQAMQMILGRRSPDILDRNTLRALSRLKRAGFLSLDEQVALTEAYIFLRDVEHKLQMVHDLQTHALPEQTDELSRCAIRLGYAARGRKAAMEEFLNDHRRHTTQVHRLFTRLLEKGITP